MKINLYNENYINVSKKEIQLEKTILIIPVIYQMTAEKEKRKKVIGF